MTTTSEHLPLWAAIRANPLDDAPRLAYADWLHGHGDEARAEFIRVQRALALLPDDRRKGRKQRAPLEPRQKDLLGAHRERWVTPFRRVLRGMRAFLDADDAWLERVPFHRGFLPIHSLELEGARRLAATGDDCEPAGEVSVSDMSPAGDPARGLAEIAAWQGAGCITGISLCGHFRALGDDAVAATVATDNLRNLTYLGFYTGSVTDAGAALIAAWPGSARLEDLNLHDNPITDAGATALAESPHLGQLRTIQLHDTRITEVGLQRLRERFGKLPWI
jgi:uncharacterized protein (TIGR02996 family)